MTCSRAPTSRPPVACPPRCSIRGSAGTTSCAGPPPTRTRAKGHERQGGSHWAGRSFPRSSEGAEALNEPKASYRNQTCSDPAPTRVGCRCRSVRAPASPLPVTRSRANDGEQLIASRRRARYRWRRRWFSRTRAFGVHPAVRAMQTAFSGGCFPGAVGQLVVVPSVSYAVFRRSFGPPGESTFRGVAHRTRSGGARRGSAASRVLGDQPCTSRRPFAEEAVHVPGSGTRPAALSPAGWFARPSYALASSLNPVASCGRALRAAASRR